MYKNKLFFLILSTTSIIATPIKSGSVLDSHTESRNKKSKVTFEESGNIIFPDHYELIKSVHKLDKVPTCAKDSKFCEEINGYPQKLIDKLLQQHAVPRAQFVVDEASHLENRNDFEETEAPLCISKRGVIYPTRGETTNEGWKYIVNSRESGYEQGIHTETCISPGTTCELYGSFGSLIGYKFQCTQRYLNRKLVTLDIKNSTWASLAASTFSIPVACCCTYSRV